MRIVVLIIIYRQKHEKSRKIRVVRSGVKYISFRS
jgi:hypothetical protein